jgi:hypothetical protein
MKILTDDPDWARDIYEARAYIAERLIGCAGSGRTMLGDLHTVAHRALLDLLHKKST